jgi:putative membrane protein
VAALAAFLHHAAAFTLVAAIAIEFVLMRGALTAASARQLRIVDAVLGAAAGIVLLVGLARVFYFEKGASYYGHNAFFIAKMALFALVALASIYPTLTFLAWRRTPVPVVDAATLRFLRRLIHWELAGVLLILLCAALMARGIGQF